jgi:hypothetical protein
LLPPLLPPYRDSAFFNVNLNAGSSAIEVTNMTTSKTVFKVDGSGNYFKYQGVNATNDVFIITNQGLFVRNND